MTMKEREEVFKKVFTIKDVDGTVLDLSFKEFSKRITSYYLKMAINGISVEVGRIDLLELNKDNEIYLNTWVVHNQDEEDEIEWFEYIGSITYNKNDKHEVIINDMNQTFTIIK